MEAFDVFPVGAMGETPIYTGGLIVVCKECGSRRMEMPHRTDTEPRMIESGRMQGSVYRDLEAIMRCVDCGAVRAVRIQTYTSPNYCVKHWWLFGPWAWHAPEYGGP